MSGCLTVVRRGAIVPVLVVLCLASFGADTDYHISRTILLGGETFWDYTAVKPANQRLFVSHGDEVDVIDLQHWKMVGKIPNTLGARGVTVAPELGRGFIACNHLNSVVIFDLNSLAVIGHVKTGNKPDDVTYDSLTGLVLAFNHDSSATVFGAADGSVKGAISLNGGPEFAVPDGTGKLFVNLQDTNELLQIDPVSLKVDHRWPVKTCEAPTSLGIDRKTRRLFVGCHNRTLVVLNADNGREVQTLPIGPGVDGTVVDEDRRLVFTASGGDGTLTIAQQIDGDHFKVVDVLKTRQSARTIALDPTTHRLYLPFAQVQPVTDQQGAVRPVPGTMSVLEVGR